MEASYAKGQNSNYGAENKGIKYIQSVNIINGYHVNMTESRWYVFLLLLTIK
jgi:hypothetical protein